MDMGYLMDTNPKTQYGLAKPSLSKVPPLPLLAVGQVMSIGAAKYGPMNWRKDPVSASTYYDAAMRHLMAWWDGQTNDPETGLPHLAHAAANLCILLDADSGPWLQDDRPLAGYTNEFISDNTKELPFHEQ
jgi:hypothetical protein